MINDKILADHLKAACEVHGKSYTDALLTGWLACTESVSTEQFSEVFWLIAQTKFPKPSDLLQAVAGIVPEDDWDKIMSVATGRTETTTISGYAATSLRQIGGVRAIANADEVGTRMLHKQFLQGIQTGSASRWSEVSSDPCVARTGTGLPAADEEISLLPIREKKTMDDHFYPIDVTGEIRANSLIRCLKAGTVSPKTAKMIIGGSRKIGLGEAANTWPAAQRDRVLAAINDLENPEPQTEPATTLAKVLALTTPVAAQ